MRQRLGIAAALLGDPPVIMLDEPFNGMDPEGIIWMRGFLRSLAGDSRALVSSHLMSELEDTADHLVIVGRGRVIADTRTRDLLAAASGDRVALPTGAPDRAAAVLEHAGATVAATGDGTLTLSGLAAEKVVVLLGENAVPFSEVSAPAARRVDQVPDRARLGDRHGDRRGGHRRRRAVGRFQARRTAASHPARTGPSARRSHAIRSPRWGRVARQSATASTSCTRRCAGTAASPSG
jgi:hypothetical protein